MSPFYSPKPTQLHFVPFNLHWLGLMEAVLCHSSTWAKFFPVRSVYTALFPTQISVLLHGCLSVTIQVSAQLKLLGRSGSCPTNLKSVFITWFILSIPDSSSLSSLYHYIHLTRFPKQSITDWLVYGPAIHLMVLGKGFRRVLLLQLWEDKVPNPPWVSGDLLAISDMLWSTVWPLSIVTCCFLSW